MCFKIMIGKGVIKKTPMQNRELQVLKFRIHIYQRNYFREIELLTKKMGR